MASKTYEIGEGGAEWASAQLGRAAEVGESYEFDDLEKGQAEALVAAGWLVESEKKEKK